MWRKPKEASVKIGVEVEREKNIWAFNQLKAKQQKMTIRMKMCQYGGGWRGKWLSWRISQWRNQKASFIGISAKELPKKKSLNGWLQRGQAEMAKISVIEKKICSNLEMAEAVKEYLSSDSLQKA
jgi:hypothetical protein